ncbi:hypothetical protein BHM03_00001326 [Ensete ventricosum]|nr:hypothetical protein BHM03_00001326 [Ensete ventricosum]
MLSVNMAIRFLDLDLQVTLSLEPSFKRSITYSFHHDDSFQDRLLDVARKHEFADLTWFPSQHKVAFRFDDRVPSNASGDGINDFIGFRPSLMAVSAAIRATGKSHCHQISRALAPRVLQSLTRFFCDAEKGYEESRNSRGKCVTAAAELAYRRLAANGLKNNRIFTGYPVVGRQGKMQTSGSCQHSPEADSLSMCAWDPRSKGLFFYETTAIFSPPKFMDFIHDVMQLRDLKPENFCGVDNYNGFLIRFIKKSDALLGQPEDSIVLDFNYYRADDPSTPRLNQDVWEEVEQMAFMKHGARPHWAKNRRVAFLGVHRKYPGFSNFLAAKNQSDPRGMFQNPWWDIVVSAQGSNTGNGCALEGQCICAEDKHCSPSKGYLCRPGLVYKEARVCRAREAARGRGDRSGGGGGGGEMVKFLKPNKAVIVLQGRFAGRKAVIVRAFDDGTRERPYGHCLVAGIAKYPKKVIRKDSAKKTAKKSRVKAFLKLVNYSHIMPTRYTLDVDLKDVATIDALQSRDKKVAACKEAKARLEERFKTGKNRWFFTKLRF